MSNKKKSKLLISVAVIAVVSGIAIFKYSNAYKGLRWEDVLHSWMHEPAVAKVMSWIGLSEETVLAGKTVYWCPMHPQVHRDKPGACPICNMQLVEMSADEAKDKGEDGSILFTSRQLQQAGVRYATVKRMSVQRQIQTTGRVEADERLLKTISAWAPGRSRIERLFVNFTGDTVRKGQRLVSIYNPDFINTQEEYRLLLQSGAKRLNTLLKSVEARLARWGISEKQIESFRNNANTMENITIRSPMSGTVIERMVTQGQYVTEGAPLLKVADLSRVWIYGDIYENELPLIKVGMPIEVSVLGETIIGKINFIDPVVQADSRTVRVRFEVSNKNGLLKPGMYTSVRIIAGAKDVLAIPESAALFTGRRVIVFVSEGEGAIFPVDVTLGRKWFYAPEQAKGGQGDFLLNDQERFHEVLSGLDEDEEVVTSANFLIAAEAQFQGALKKIAPSEFSESKPDSDTGT